MSFGGFSFGAPTQPAAQQQPQPAATGGLFGAPAASSSSGGGLFGSTPNSNPTGSLFGAPGATQSSTAPKPTFGGFGTTPSQPNQAGSSLFGAPASAPSTTPSLFGQPAQQQQQQQPSTGGLFGSTAQPAQQQQQQQPSTGGLFGSTAQPAQPSFGGGLFGSTATQPSAGGSNLFGGSNQTQQPSQQPAQQQQQQNNLTVSQLGNPGGLGASTIAAGMRAPLKIEDVPIEQRIEYIKASWDPSSPHCRFKYFFYNVVSENEVGFYARPNNIDDSTWFKAQRDNPDPASMVPALAVGFDDIRKRVDAQTKMAGAHWGKLQEISQRLTNLSKSSHLSLSLRVSRSHLLQTQLSHRTLMLIRHLHLLIPTLRSSSIRREEEVLTERLSMLAKELEGGRGTGGDGNIKGRMMELWGLLSQVKSERDKDRNGRGGEGQGLDGWAVVDDDAMERLAKIIADQQTALQHLTKVLREDLVAIETMRQGFGLTSKDSSQRSS